MKANISVKTLWYSKLIQKPFDRYVFTLMELLITISLIVILAAILLPGLKKARDISIQIECANQLKQVGLAALMWGEEHKGQLPDRVGYGASTTLLNDYGLFSFLTNENSLKYKSIMTCSALARKYPPEDSLWGRTYSINMYSTGSHVNSGIYSQNITLWYTNFTKIGKPSQQSFFFDGVGRWDAFVGYYSTHGYEVRMANTFLGTGEAHSFPHSKMSNVVFIDGHVDKISYDFAFQYLQISRTHPFWGAVY